MLTDRSEMILATMYIDLLTYFKNTISNGEYIRRLARDFPCVIVNKTHLGVCVFLSKKNATL